MIRKNHLIDNGLNWNQHDVRYYKQKEPLDIIIYKERRIEYWLEKSYIDYIYIRREWCTQ